MKRSRSVVVVGVLAVMGATAALAVLAPAASAGWSVAFECNGANQTWTVPAWATTARFDLYGASGGDAADGGLGGRTTATIPVTPGEIFNLTVGCEGGAGTNAVTGSGGDGGFGGGADGGDRSVAGGNGGGGGGGASDVRRAGTGLADRILIAGGGGGGGASTSNTGGDGGGATGEDGTDAPAAGGADGGGGASGATPGVAGTPAGTAGTLGVGGAGATNPGASTGLAGGGGGGGRAGGGGGGYDPNGWGGGGGGGGSGLGTVGATLTSGVQEGDGRIIVTVPFSDVPPGPPAAPFYDEITWLADSGITGGFDDGTFRPTLTISRQGMAAFLYRLEGSPLGDDPICATAPFPDVPTSNPFCGEIDWLVDEGITGGFPDGTFRPGQSISRQSMAGFLYRVAGEPDGDDPTCTSAPFPDVATSNPFCGEIDWMVDENITGGFLDGTFRPTSAVSRQGMAAFLFRFDQLAT